MNVWQLTKLFSGDAWYFATHVAANHREEKAPPIMTLRLDPFCLWVSVESNQRKGLSNANASLC